MRSHWHSPIVRNSNLEEKSSENSLIFRQWFATVLCGLAILQIQLSAHFGHPGLFSLSLLFWVATLSLLWQQRQHLPIKRDRLSSFLGSALLALICYKSLHLFESDFFLRLSPLLSLLGWALLASGFKGLKQYRQTLFLLSFLAIPWEFVYIFDVSLLTAKFSAFLLWLLGFDISRQGVWLILPTGSVEVYNGCSGVRSIMQLLGLSWLVLTLVPTRWQQKIGLPLGAIFLGFIINGIRVALMAVLVALSNWDGFDYWHVGNGSLIFSAIAVLSFGLFCLKTLPSSALPSGNLPSDPVLAAPDEELATK